MLSAVCQYVKCRVKDLGHPFLDVVCVGSMRFSVLWATGEAVVRCGRIR